MAQLIIDAHSHVLVEEAEILAAEIRRRYPSTAGMDFQGRESVKASREKFSAINKPLIDVKRKLEDMDRMGIDLSVLSTSPMSYHAWAEGEDAARLSRLQNEAMSEMVRQYPDRFAVLATIPLQDVALGWRN